MKDKNNSCKHWLLNQELKLDSQLRRLQLGTNCFTLPDLSFKLLQVLTLNAPNLVSHQELIQFVWGEVTVTDATLQQRVKILRQQLSKAGVTSDYISAVRGQGYRLNVSATQHQAASSPTTHNLFKPSIVVILAGLAAYLGWFFLINQTEAELGLAPKQVSTTPVNSRNSSELEQLLDKANQYFSRYRPQDNKLALQLYKRAQALDDDSIEVHTGLAHSYAHQAFNGIDDTAGRLAVEHAKRAIELSDSSVEALIALGSAQTAYGLDREGIKAYQQALQKDPENPRALTNLAINYSRVGEDEHSLYWMLKAVKQYTTDPFGHIHLSRVLFRLGLDEPANYWFKKAVTLNPEDSYAALNRINFLYHTERYQEAMAQISTILELDPRNATNYYYAGDILFAKGEPSEAYNHYLLAEKYNNDPEYLHTHLALLYKIRGNQEAQNKLLDTKFDYLTKEFQQSPESHYHMISFAEIFAVKEEWQESLSWLNKAVTTGYNNHWYLSSSPLFLGLKENPQFEGLIQQIKQKLKIKRESALALLDEEQKQTLFAEKP